MTSEFGSVEKATQDLIDYRNRHGGKPKEHNVKIVFRTNLGLADAKKCNLEPAKCLVGNTADVPNDVGEAFIKRGIAVAADKAADDAVIQSALEERHKQEAAKEVRGVAKKAEVTAPSPESFSDNPHDTSKKTSK